MNKAITLLAALFVVLLFADCKKEKDIVDPVGNNNNSSSNTIDTAALINNIGGTRYWTGGHEYYSSTDTSSMPVNDVFAIAKNGHTTVNVQGYTLTLEKIDTTKRKIKYAYRSIGTMSFFVELEYYYTKDSMTWLDSTALYNGNWIIETTRLHTWSGISGIDTMQITSNIVGVRYWTGSSSSQPNINDTFEVFLQGNSSVNVLNDVLPVYNIDTVNKIVNYTKNIFNYPTTTHIELKYYYNLDSMTYIYSSQTGLGGSWSKYLHTQ